MSLTCCPSLGELLARFARDPAVGEMAAQLRAAEANDGVAKVIRLCELTFPVVERRLWADGLNDEAIALYQAAFREYEEILARRPDDQRHRFVVVVPVADRPQHLQNFLGSLLELCRLYCYGGVHNGRFSKVSVIVADDSAEDATIRRNREIADEFTRQGVETVHFDATGQERELHALSHGRPLLNGVVGEPEQNGFSHKGASITRNIAYLYARRLFREDERTLVWFIDSDEQFKVRVARKDGVADVVALNYFHWLNRIFSAGDVDVLTGKVVGDPPVSPAVMAGNFLADIRAFLEQMAALPPDASCGFHGGQRTSTEDAAYHDMADLFGFEQAKAPFIYHCDREGPHDHRDCLHRFAAKLDRFFDGDHPTRESYYERPDSFPGVKPARTVYTGNYVFNGRGLDYFVPFAPLKLRMAGPVLGRIIKAEIGERFVTASLPLLHTRTVDDCDFEFRPGVDRKHDSVDLSGEFERQFFGDVMLFTIEKLTETGYPQRLLAESEIERALDEVEGTMYRRYIDKQAEIRGRLDEAERIVDSPERWWNRLPGNEEAVSNLRRFFANIKQNFGDDAAGYRLIRDDENRQRRRTEIRKAIAAYTVDRKAWETALASEQAGPKT